MRDFLKMIYYFHKTKKKQYYQIVSLNISDKSFTPLYIKSSRITIIFYNYKKIAKKKNVWKNNSSHLFQQRIIRLSHECRQCTLWRTIFQAVKTHSWTLKFSSGLRARAKVAAIIGPHLNDIVSIASGLSQNKSKNALSLRAERRARERL